MDMILSRREAVKGVGRSEGVTGEGPKGDFWEKLEQLKMLIGSV